MDADFCRYYRQLYYIDFFNGGDKPVKCFRARYGSHITLYNSLYHESRQNVGKFDGITVQWFYDPMSIYQGGRTKGFIGFYMQIESPDIDKILNKLGIMQVLHLSLFNNKFEKSQIPT